VERGRFFWVWGVVICAGAIASILFIGAPLQFIFGLWGLLLTELVLLAFAVGAASHLHICGSEMVRIKAPSLKQAAGTVVLVLAGVILSGIAGYVYYFLFPEQTHNAYEYTALFRSEHGFFTWLIVAVSPAICEEYLHRGLILQTFVRSGIKKKWLIVLANGILFGLFHLDPPRFLSTAVLGMILAYLMLESQNFVLPVLYHLLNNTFSLFANLLSSDAAGISPDIGTAGESPGGIFAVICILSVCALFLLRLGAVLVRPPE